MAQSNYNEHKSIELDNTGTHVLIKKLTKYPGYAVGRLGTFELLIRVEDGFVNASKFISKYRTKKEKFNDWCKHDKPQRLIAFVQEQTQQMVVMESNFGGNDLKGTWVHPDIIIAGMLYFLIVGEINRW